MSSAEVIEEFNNATADTQQIPTSIDDMSWIQELLRKEDAIRSPLANKKLMYNLEEHIWREYGGQ